MFFKQKLIKDKVIRAWIGSDLRRNLFQLCALAGIHFHYYI